MGIIQPAKKNSAKPAPRKFGQVPEKINVAKETKALMDEILTIKVASKIACTACVSNATAFSLSLISFSPRKILPNNCLYFMHLSHCLISWDSTPVKIPARLQIHL